MVEKVFAPNSELHYSELLLRIPQAVYQIRGSGSPTIMPTRCVDPIVMRRRTFPAGFRGQLHADSARDFPLELAAFTAGEIKEGDFRLHQMASFTSLILA